MAVGRIGEIPVDGLATVVRQFRLREPDAQQRNLGPRDGILIGAQPGRRMTPFGQDPGRPQGNVKPRPRQIGQDFPQDRREQDIGVKNRAHQSSRKNSALR
jgi:hypothetical protein